ncbi:MAG: YjbR, partial [Bacillales bacterium]|nr:YjbR [Bacillales bacterium]
CNKNKISDLVEFNSHIYYGSHMNKNHWITIEIDAAMPNLEIKNFKPNFCPQLDILIYRILMLPFL